MNLNTILAPLSVGRLRDPLLVAVDLWLLGTNDYRAVFPIVDHAWGFALLERAYLFLFAQISRSSAWWSGSRGFGRGHLPVGIARRRFPVLGNVADNRAGLGKHIPPRLSLRGRHPGGAGHGCVVLAPVRTRRPVTSPSLP